MKNWIKSRGENKNKKNQLNRENKKKITEKPEP